MIVNDCRTKNFWKIGWPLVGKFVRDSWTFLFGGRMPTPSSLPGLFPPYLRKGTIRIINKVKQIKDAFKFVLFPSEWFGTTSPQWWPHSPYWDSSSRWGTTWCPSFQGPLALRTPGPPRRRKSSPFLSTELHTTPFKCGTSRWRWKSGKRIIQMR